MIHAQRLIRHKGSKSAVNVGTIMVFDSISELREYAMSGKKVWSFTTDDGSIGIMRSGRAMRPCDQHVWNVKAPKAG